MRRRVLLLAPPGLAETLAAILAEEASGPAVQAIATEAELAAVADLLSPRDVLIACGTGVVVAGSILDRLQGAAYNFHAASPEYPGRDPHHFAVYEGATRYGATAHVMNRKVDAGPILGVEWFDVPPGVTPNGLLALANDAALRLFRRLAPRMAAGDEPLPEIDVAWGPRKTTRADFLRLCRLPPYLDRDEFERRARACAAEGHGNLVVEMYGRCFRLNEATAARPRDGGHDWSGFTEAAYGDIVDLARATYRFAGYRERGTERHVLWRHDVDLSVHRALRLAEIECGKGVTATYFFFLHSAFYNLMEPAVRQRAKRIAALGHAVGLHFDAANYSGKAWTSESLEPQLATERDLLATLLDRPVEAVSFHNPDVGGVLA